MSEPSSGSKNPTNSRVAEILKLVQACDSLSAIQRYLIPALYGHSDQAKPDSHAGPSRDKKSEAALLLLDDQITLDDPENVTRHTALQVFIL
jgi:hypothetical protein